MNTSGEGNKNGIEPANVTETVQHILENCPKLKFCGLMTIGDLGNSMAASQEVMRYFIAKYLYFLYSIVVYSLHFHRLL